MDNLTIKIGEREIPLRFRMTEFMEIEENVGNLGEVKQLILKGKSRVRNMIRIIRILGNAGLRHAGQDADLTEEWLEENMDPHALLGYQLAVMACMTKAGESQAEKEMQKEAERDLVLEEIQAKKEPVNSPTGA